MTNKHNINFNLSGKKRWNLSGRRKVAYAFSGAALFAFAFMLSYCASMKFFAPDESDAISSSTINASVQSQGYYINLASSGDVEIDVNAVAGGTTATGTDTVTVTTNTPGYRVYVSTDDTLANSNRLYMSGDRDSEYYIEPVSNTTPGELQMNTWGFSLDGTNFQAVPLRGAEVLVASKTGLTAGTETSNKHNITYGVKADLATPAGRYSTTVAYSVSADASTVSNIASVYPSKIYRDASGSAELTIETQLMTNMEYGAWTVKVGSTTYPSSAVTTSTTENGTLRLRVMVPKNTAVGTYTVTATSDKFGTWTAASALSFKDLNFFTISDMQEMTDAVCKTATQPAKTAINFDTTGAHAGQTSYVPQTTLRDRRDGKTYLVRRLADGNCWMSQNLEFDILGEGDTYYTGTSSNAAANNSDVAVTATNYFGGTVNESFTLTSEDTDLHTVDTWTPAIFRTAANTAGKPYAKVYRTITGTRETTDATYGWANNGNDGMRSYNYANSKADWAYSIPTGDFDASGNMKFTSAATGQPYQRYGNLYNWTAATLGSGLGLSTDGQQAKDSICPKGWQLPDNEGTKSFKNLLTTAYGLNANGASVSDSNALNSAPLHFLRTGWYNRAYGNISGRTTYAHWWSNIAGSTTRGRYLYTGQGYAYAQTSTLRGYGFAIRCVAR